MPKPTPAKESDVLSGVLQLLKLRGVRAYRFNAGMFRDKGGRPVFLIRDLDGRPAKGVSDIIGWTCDGRFLAVEVKRPGGKPRPEQAEFLDAVRTAGGVALLIDNLATLDAALRRLAEAPGARMGQDGEVIG